jgi:hypothetical protein
VSAASDAIGKHDVDVVVQAALSLFRVAREDLVDGTADGLSGGLGTGSAFRETSDLCVVA